MGGFDISAIPAIFILDLVGQATAALGAEFPKHLKDDMGAASKQSKVRVQKKFAPFNFKYSK